MKVEAPKTFVVQALWGVLVGTGVIVVIMLSIIGLFLAIDIALGDTSSDEFRDNLYVEDLRYESPGVIQVSHNIWQEPITLGEPDMSRYNCRKTNEWLLFLMKDTAAKLAIHPEWADIYTPTIQTVHSAWCHDYD